MAPSKLNLINDSNMVKSAMILYKAIRKYAPYKKIKDSVFISRVSGTDKSRSITVGINTNPRTGGAPFARAFDIGSGIHGKFSQTYPIDAKNFPNLIFKGTKALAGKIIRVPHVDHPGVMGVGYTNRALEESRPKIKKELGKEVRENLRLYLKASFTKLGK